MPTRSSSPHPPRAIHLHDAVRLLADHDVHDLRLWKLSTGDILEYHGVRRIGAWVRGGLVRVKFSESGQVRAFRAIALFEIDGLAVYI